MNKKLTKILIGYMAEISASRVPRLDREGGMAPPLTREEVFDDAIDKMCDELESLTFKEFQALRSR
jgi:hypothetical protein